MCGLAFLHRGKVDNRAIGRARLADFRGAGQVDECQVMVGQWQAHFRVVGGKGHAKPRAGIHVLPEVGFFLSHHPVIGQGNACPFEIALRLDEVGLGGGQRCGSRRVLRFRAIPLRAQFQGAVVFDLPLRQCRLGLIDGNDVVRGVDAQQFFAFREDTARDELRRDADY